MPEIGEVGKTISKIVAPDDANVFGKVGCSGPNFQKALEGKKIVGAGRQGKYFWLELNKGPHPCFHFGMTGWMHIKGIQTFYYKRSTPPSEDHAEWPPKYWKFTLETAETPDSPAVVAAFTDARRFARIRLLDCEGSKIRETTPLVENGPDPTIDKNILTLEWFTELMRRKHVPVKALLLDQANISGIGNWVGDEIMYHAKLHPEQYSNTFSDSQLAKLHQSLMYVCDLAVDNLSDSSKFPEEWLFKHRWGKGKNDAPTSLPTGEKIAFLTVGGRTTCIVPSLQKKTGAVKAEVTEDDFVESKVKAKKGKKKSSKVTDEAADETAETSDSSRDREESVKSDEEEHKTARKPTPKKGAKAKSRPKGTVEKQKAGAATATRKRKSGKLEPEDAVPKDTKANVSKKVKGEQDNTEMADGEGGRRRSGRLRK